MNQIQELREKRAKAWDAAKAFLESCLPSSLFSLNISYATITRVWE